jgi:hypothetical protein
MGKKAVKAWKKMEERKRRATIMMHLMCLCGHLKLKHKKGACFEGYNMNPEGMKCNCPGFIWKYAKKKYLLKEKAV